MNFMALNLHQKTESKAHQPRDENFTVQRHKKGGGDQHSRKKSEEQDEHKVHRLFAKRYAFSFLTTEMWLSEYHWASHPIPWEHRRQN